ncbi:hypothetical protein BVRB_4g087730 [Beta vulgaris subsp. vulgaris]|nr:hypothetical protein BVRB_4g087730 [Beta vulgaris subsp. vulgaris]
MEDKVNNIRRPPHPPQGETPWLVYTHGNSRKKQIQTFCTSSPLPPNNNFYIKSIPELRGKSIEGSCYGWLILNDLKDRKIFSLYNSTSFEIINLPPLPLPDIEENIELTSCTLTSPPSANSNCVLFLFFGNQVFSCHPTTIRHNDNWHTQQLQLDSPTMHILHIRNAVTLNGIIYCWAIVQEHHNANDDDSEDDGDNDSNDDSEEDDGDDDGDDDSEDDGDDDGDDGDDDSGVEDSNDDADVYSGMRDYVVSMEVVDEPTNSLSLKIITRKMQKWDYSYVHGEDYLLESCGTIYWVGFRITHYEDEKIGQSKSLEVGFSTKGMD